MDEVKIDVNNQRSDGNVMKKRGKEKARMKQLRNTDRMKESTKDGRKGKEGTKFLSVLFCLCTWFECR
jgi:hypothetical protein